MQQRIFADVILCVRCNLLHCLSVCVSVWGAVMLYGRVCCVYVCVGARLCFLRSGV